MAIVSTGSAVGTIDNVSTIPGSATGVLDGDGEGYASGLLLITLRQALDGSTTSYDRRVVLDDEDVTRYLVGSHQILTELDRLTSSEVSVQGEKFSFLGTETTWTRTPIQIYHITGLPGNQFLTLEFNGYVSRATEEDNYIYRLTCVDKGTLSSQTKVCLDLGPEQGLTRGEIARDVLLTAGFDAVSIPDGEVYDKPYNFTGKVWGEVVEFLEPAGLHLRVLTDGTVEGFTIDTTSTIPDHVWFVGDLIEEFSVSPPEGVSSVQIWRGNITDRLRSGQGAFGEGLTTIEITRTTIEGTYNKYPIKEQLENGTIQDIDYSPLTHGDLEKEGVVQVIEVETHKVGTLLVLKIERQWEWRNAEAAQYISRIDNAGPGPQGTDYRRAFIEVDGRYVAWRNAKFLQTLERKEEFIRDEEGTEIGKVITQRLWTKTRNAFKDLIGDTRSGVRIGSDNVSYVNWSSGAGIIGDEIERFQVASRFTVDKRFNDETGSVKRETQTTESIYVVRTRLDGYYVSFDGQGMELDKEELMVTNEKETVNVIDASGRLTGQIFIEREWTTTESPVGQFDWGEFFSEFEKQRFSQTKSFSEAYTVKVVGQLEQSEYGESSRDVDLTTGNPPLPEYRASEYTRYISESVEIVIDDALVEKWFGRRSEIEEVKHVLTESELLDVATRRRSRELSYRVKAVRVHTFGEIGDTVLLLDTNKGLYHIGFIVSRNVSRGYANGRTEYLLEIPMNATGLPL